MSKYYPPRGTGDRDRHDSRSRQVPSLISRESSEHHNRIDKRPSVFDRLGSKRSNNADSNSGRRQAPPPESQQFKREYEPKTYRDRDREHDHDREYRSNSKTRSVTPRYHQKESPPPPPNPQIRTSRDIRSRSTDEFTRKSEYRTSGNSAKKYTNTNNNEVSNGNNKNKSNNDIIRREREPKSSSTGNRYHNQPKTSTSTTAPTPISPKSYQSTKSSHDDSTSSRSRSLSSSSGSDGSNSSSTSRSSSSDSSVPSVKLAARKLKSKKVKRTTKTKRHRDKNHSVNVKRSGVAKPIKSPNSSSGSPAPPRHNNTRTTTSIGREKIKEVSRDSPRHTHIDSTRGVSRHRDEISSRKRKLSEESGSTSKRSRYRSPSSPSMTRYSGGNSPMRTTPGPDNRRGHPRERIRVIPPSPKRPDYHERDMGRNYSSSRQSPAPPRYKHNDRDNEVGDKRPRERLAPARNTPIVRDRRPPPRDREEFENVKRVPLLPYLSKPQMQNRGPGGFYEDSNNRNMKSIPPPKRSPMIVKTKEALLEKYEDFSKKSRVDMWVDETLRPGNERPALLPTPKPPILDSRNKPIPSLLGLPLISRSSLNIPPVKNNNSCTNAVTNKKNRTKEKEIETFEENLSEISEGGDLSIEEEGGEEETKVESSDLIEVTTTTATTKVEKIESETEVTTTCLPKPTDTSPHPPINNVEADVKPSEIKSSTQSQIEDDILDDMNSMDFEEISDEELVVDKKIGIADALGIDWSVLVCRRKLELTSDQVDVSNASDKAQTKERWSMSSIFKRIGIPKSLIGEELFQKIVDKVSEAEERYGIADKTSKEELINPVRRWKRSERKSCIEKYALGSATRALSSKREMGFRRYLMGLPHTPTPKLE